MIGATIARTGTPAAASSRIARKLAAGVAVRGSSVRASSASSVVMLSATLTRCCSAIGDQKIEVAQTSAFLVIMHTGWRASSSTSKSPRVSLNCRSAG